MSPLPESLLVVDDDPLARKLLSSIFTTGGIGKVCVVDDYDSAVAEVAKGAFSVIVSDYHLPGKSGLDLLEKLRKDGDATPFLLISGVLNKEGALLSTQYAHTEFISKPFLITELMSTVKRLAAR